MLNEKVYVRAMTSHYRSRIELTALTEDGTACAEPPTFRPREDGEFVAPTMVINFDAAQVLMDDLWAAGIRPTEGAGSAGSLLATERHLNDMRAIVGRKLGVEL